MCHRYDAISRCFRAALKAPATRYSLEDCPATPMGLSLIGWAVSVTSAVSASSKSAAQFPQADRTKQRVAAAEFGGPKQAVAVQSVQLVEPVGSADGATARPRTDSPQVVRQRRAMTAKQIATPINGKDAT